MAIETKKNSLGGDVVYLTASKIAISMISLITSMLLARFRTLSEYGTYSQIIMVTDLISTILLLGLPNSINYFLAKASDEKEKQKFLSVYTTLNTILTIIIGLSLYFAIPLIVRYFNNPLITGFAYVFAIYPWASVMINSLSNVCIVYGKANKLVIYNIIHAITTLIILLFAKFFHLSFQQYMILYMISMFGFGIASVIWIRAMAGALHIKVDWKLIKQVFVFSIPMGLASVVGTLNTELGKLVIGKFFTTEEYAIYANAAKELPVMMLATSMTAVLLPKLVRLLKDGENEKAAKLWGNSINLSLCFMCLIAGGFFVFAPDIMSLFYSEKYVTAGGVAVFRIYAIILLFRSTYWGIVLNATGNTKFIFVSAVLTLAANMLGNIIGCYLFGFIGPAISNLVAIAIMDLVQLVFTSKIIKMELKHIFPWKSIFKLILQMIIFSIIFCLTKYVFIGEYARNISIFISIGLGVVWSLLYVCLNLKFIKKNWKQLNE